MRFAAKARLAPVWPAIAALAIAALILWALLPRVIRHRSADDLRSFLAVLAPLVAEVATDRPDDLHAWVRELARGTELRITVVASGGTVIADSARTAAQLEAMDNHGDRPEIRTALSGGRGVDARRSLTMGERYLYVAESFTTADGRLYALRLARPSRELLVLRAELLGAFAVAALAAALVSAAIAWWRSQRLARPLAALRADAERIAADEPNADLEVPDDEDLAALARSLARIREQGRAELAALTADRDHLQAILAGMSEGVLVSDSEGQAQWANPVFRRLFGLEEEVEGRSLLEITRQPQLDRMLSETLGHGESRRTELELEGPEGRTVSLASTPLPGGEGVVVVARDVTDILRVHAMRRDFVANVSHELKTPLAAIRGYAETLADGAVDERDTALRFTGRIVEQCRRLEALLEDLLTLARLERPETARERQPVDLGQVIRRAVEVLSGAASERRVAVSIEQDPGLPHASGDPEALERMVANLVDNAIKYNAPGGTVVVRLKRVARGIALEVADTGIGIPAHSLQRIFERFYRVDRGRARAEGGTGLGLAIVKHAAQLHGGRVQVESEPGKGSVFRVFLPVEEPPG